MDKYEMWLRMKAATYRDIGKSQSFTMSQRRKATQSAMVVEECLSQYRKMKDSNQ